MSLTRVTLAARWRAVRPRSIPLVAQLLLTLVGLLLAATVALIISAYNASIDNLESEARRTVQVSAQSREQTITQLLTLRQQRADGFLMSVQTLCGEPALGRFGWSEDCVTTMADDFRVTEGASGVLLSYRGRRLRSTGRTVSIGVPSLGALAKVVRVGPASVYVMQARLSDLLLEMEFDLDQIMPLFVNRSGLGATGEVFLTDADGAFLTPARFATTGIPPGTGSLEAFRPCRAGDADVIEFDYRGVHTVHAMQPVAALGGACIHAHLAHDEALAPALRLRRDLIGRGAIFVLLGALFSLFAAQWIATPVLRLAAAARALQQGQFAETVPVGGPSEIQALGHAFDAMRRDLSVLVAREQAARREAEVANRAKDEFLATVSHELRTPLTAILGWIRLLRMGRLPTERATYAMGAIHRSAESQRRLIEDLLDVSRIVSRRLRLVRSATRLAEVVDAALDAVRPQANEKGIRLDVRVVDADLVVMGDAQRLEQVVWNLAWNAVKFTPQHGRIDITLRRAGDHAELTVVDTGVGITAGFLPHVFEWFRQDKDGQTQGGLGVGLGIVHQILQLHDGSIRAESRGEGRGATFVVTLPLHTSAAANRPAPATADLAGAALALSSCKVLVVDDDASTRDVVRAVLEDAGAQVHCVASAADARTDIAAWPPDVLVSDVRMPDESGYDLLRWIRESQLAIPAIALTAYARRQDAKEAYAAGFQVHMPKPADASRLIATVARLASGSER